jgi:hypothetical protein
MATRPGTCVRGSCGFASELTESPFAARDALRGRDARVLAREILAMTQAEFSRAFDGSPMKRARLRGAAWTLDRSASSRPRRSAITQIRASTFPSDVETCTTIRPRRQ